MLESSRESLGLPPWSTTGLLTMCGLFFPSIALDRMGQRSRSRYAPKAWSTTCGADGLHNKNNNNQGRGGGSSEPPFSCPAVFDQAVVVMSPEFAIDFALTGDTENASILVTILRSIPNRRAASRRLKPSR